MRAWILIAAATPLWSAPALAQPASAARPQTIDAVLDCRAVQPAEARLACFDRAAAALGAASSAGEIMIVDRGEVRAARRSLFGFSLPRLALFGGGGDSKEQDEVKEIKSQVKRASSVGHGKYRVVIAADDAAWETTDSSLSVREPRPGDAIHIKKGSLGSYFIRFGSQRWVRGRRVQ